MQEEMREMKWVLRVRQTRIGARMRRKTKTLANEIAMIAEVGRELSSLLFPLLFFEEQEEDVCIEE